MRKKLTYYFSVLSLIIILGIIINYSYLIIPDNQLSTQLLLKKYNEPEALRTALSEKIKKGVPKAKIDKLLTRDVNGFKTLEYFQQHDKKLFPRRAGKSFLVIYYVPEQLNREKNANWLYTPGWEFWVRYDPAGNLESYEIKRIKYKYTDVQTDLLYQNQENLKGE